jgi:hypothetical protein
LETIINRLVEAEVGRLATLQDLGRVALRVGFGKEGRG